MHKSLKSQTAYMIYFVISINIGTAAVVILNAGVKYSRACKLITKHKDYSPDTIRNTMKKSGFGPKMPHELGIKDFFIAGL